MSILREVLKEVPFFSIKNATKKICSFLYIMAVILNLRVFVTAVDARTPHNRAEKYSPRLCI